MSDASYKSIGRKAWIFEGAAEEFGFLPLESTAVAASATPNIVYQYRRRRIVCIILAVILGVAFGN